MSILTTIEKEYLKYVKLHPDKALNFRKDKALNFRKEFFNPKQKLSFIRWWFDKFPIIQLTKNELDVIKKIIVKPKSTEWTIVKDIIIQTRQQKLNNTKSSKEITFLLLFIVTYDQQRIIYRGSREIQLISYDHEHDEMTIHDDHSLLPFSRGNRACLHDGGCEAEMFFSFFYLFILLFYCL